MKPHARYALLCCALVLMIGASGCMTGYRFSWNYMKEAQTQKCYAYAYWPTRLTVSDIFGGHPDSVDWWVVPSDLGTLSDEEGMHPPYTRMFAAGRKGGEATVYAAHGPDVDDVISLKVTVFPSFIWTQGGSTPVWYLELDVDQDNICDVYCVQATHMSESRMKFPHGVRCHLNYPPTPEELALVPANVSAPDSSLTEWDYEDGYKLVIFNASGGGVYAGVCFSLGGSEPIPALVYRWLR